MHFIIYRENRVIEIYKHRNFKNFARKFPKNIWPIFDWCKGDRVLRKQTFAHAEPTRTTGCQVYIHAELTRATSCQVYIHAEPTWTTGCQVYIHAKRTRATGCQVYIHAKPTRTTGCQVNIHAKRTRATGCQVYIHAKLTWATAVARIYTRKNRPIIENFFELFKASIENLFRISRNVSRIIISRNSLEHVPSKFPKMGDQFSGISLKFPQIEEKKILGNAWNFYSLLGN